MAHWLKALAALAEDLDFPAFTVGLKPLYSSSREIQHLLASAGTVYTRCLYIYAGKKLVNIK